MPRDASTKLTYEDFLSFPDDGRRHELIDGEHYVTPSPNTRHQRLVARLFDAIYDHLKVRWIVDPELDVVKVFRREAQGLSSVADLSREAGDNLTAPLLPGLAISLPELFR